MVALKHAGLACAGRRNDGSRNAVVALKRKQDPAHGLPRCPKQERRGGIETSDHSIFSKERSEKQERRGGIETRSRLISLVEAILKQERRGGIETHHA